MLNLRVIICNNRTNVNPFEHIIYPQIFQYIAHLVFLQMVGNLTYFAAVLWLQQELLYLNNF